MAVINNAKTQCDGKCETCILQWQMQCAARFGFKNNMNQKILDERLDTLEEILKRVSNKINDVFGTEDINVSPQIVDTTPVISEKIDESPIATIL